MNLALARTFTTRSWQEITGQQNTCRYKGILATLRAADPEQPGPIQPGDIHGASSTGVCTQPTSQSPVTITQGLLDPIKIGEDLRRVGINNARLEEAHHSRPAGMAEVNIIMNHFNVSSTKKGGTGGSKKRKRRPAKNRNQRRRERYAEHQRLYSLGPKVLVDELRLDGADPAVLLGELHRVYNLLMSMPSRPVDGFITYDPVLNIEVEPFTDGELRGVLKNTDAKTAPGPDGLTLKEVSKIPPAILAIIFTNWLAFTHFRTTLRALLRRFSQDHVFHELQGGFGDDRSASSNIIILQALIKARKQARQSFFSLSLDIRKAFDTVSHHAIIEVLKGRGLPPRYIKMVRDLYHGSSTIFWSGGVTDGVRVPVRQGIKQGDPLSPFLFNCVLDPLLMNLNRDSAGLDVGDSTIGALAFADDLILTSLSYEGLKSLLKSTEEYLAEHAEDDLILIESSSLKPFQKLRCINTLIMPKYLYTASSILGSSRQSAAIDKALRIHIKTLLHLPLSFPNTHMHLAAWDGGLGCLNIERVAQEVQFTALARLVRLGSRAVDHFLNTTLGPYHCRLASQLRVPPDLTDAKELTAALGQSRKDWWRETQAAYQNKDLFAHQDQPWGIPGSSTTRGTSRTETVSRRCVCGPTPTRPQLASPSQPGSVRPTLQEVPPFTRNPIPYPSGVCVHQTPEDGASQLHLQTNGDRVIIADVAVSWDDRPQSLRRMCEFKSAKYDCLRPLYPDKVVTAISLAFGARSMLRTGTVQGGASLGIPKCDMAWLASRALVGSLICLNRFMKA
ncbi:hypothetical protein ISCGN_025221 [Ixodes scapularis]